MKLKKIEITSTNYNNIDNTHDSILPCQLPSEYIELLHENNGGLSYDGYFHFIGLNGPLQHNLLKWNDRNLWKKYFDLNSTDFVFAEDLFGNQYYFKLNTKNNPIYVLWIDTGKSDFMADNFGYFIKDIVEEPLDEVMGEFKKLAFEYFSNPQNKWEPFKHINHKIPIVVGGKDSIDNFELCDSVSHLFLLGQLISQLKKLPIGTHIKDVILDKDKMEVRLII